MVGMVGVSGVRKMVLWKSTVILFFAGGLLLRNSVLCSVYIDNSTPPAFLSRSQLLQLYRQAAMTLRARNLRESWAALF